MSTASWKSRLINAAPPQPLRRRVVVDRHEKVDVAVRAGVAAGAGAEEDHAPRLEPADDGVEELRRDAVVAA
jgi:hypothetical protein